MLFPLTDTVQCTHLVTCVGLRLIEFLRGAHFVTLCQSFGSFSVHPMIRHNNPGSIETLIWMWNTKAE